MIMRKRFWVLVFVILAAGCAAPGVAPSAAVKQSAPTATPTRARPQPPTRTPVSATATPTVAPTATATAAATATSAATARPSATPVAAPGVVQPSTKVGSASSVQLALDTRKYPAPQLLSPDDGATYHVSQPVVQMAWKAMSTELMTFGQTPGCTSDAANFRRALEVYQLVIRSLDGERPDQVQWEESTQFALNLTPLPEGRYSWAVNVATVCESYVVGQRASTISRSYLAPASLAGAVRTFVWQP